MVPEALPAAPLWVRALATMIRRLPVGRYWTTDLCNQYAQPFLAYLPKEFGAYSFRCDLRDSISREVCFQGHYEAQETILIRHILKPKMCFVDVGANWGYYTLLAAHMVGGLGKVISIEPDPRLFPVLEANVRRNRLHQVTPLQFAALNETTLVRLAGYDERNGNFGLSHIAANDSLENSFEVKARTLDQMFDEFGLESIDLLKMDIEGAEGFALKGAAKALKEYRIHRLLLELHPQQLNRYGHLETEIISRLMDLGYNAWRIDHSNATTRLAAYGRKVALRKILLPYNGEQKLDSWPHLLWQKPGLQETW